MLIKILTKYQFCNELKMNFFLPQLEGVVSDSEEFFLSQISYILFRRFRGTVWSECSLCTNSESPFSSSNL